MADHYKTLGLEPGAKQEEIEAAFQRLLAERKSRRRKTSDLVAAHVVLSDGVLRRAYDVSRFGEAANEKLVVVKDSVVEALPEVNWSEVRSNAWQATLKATVLVSGATAKAADAAARVSRRLQIQAAKRITREE